MKRADIEAGRVYAHSEHRSMSADWAHPYLILSTVIHSMPDRHSRRTTWYVPPGAPAKPRAGDLWHSAAGMPAVQVTDEGMANLDRVKELATLNGHAPYDALMDGPDVQLGTYKLVTSMAFLIGDYAEWKAALDAREARNKLYAAEAEAANEAAKVTYDGLNERLEALGITGYARGSWERKTRFEGLKFDDMESLIERAEMYEQGLAPLKDIN